MTSADNDDRKTTHSGHTVSGCVHAAKTMVHLLYLFVGMALSGMLFITAQARAELPVPTRVGDSHYRWDGANTPVVNGKQLRIDQTAQNAVLNWRSFNIGADSSVHFNQPSSSAIALNRIFQNDPSRILGNLEANGQVFLINQNGFLFGSKANVDVNTLIASTLDIDDRIFEDVGLVGAINETGNLPAFEAAGEMRSIKIMEGASLHTQNGGRIMILAPKIENRGSIETPGGQAILAASYDKVYLASSTDPNLRGLLVEVQTGGDVNNLGEIIAERGNISLLGLAVNQQGLVRATTSATLNGSVYLKAEDDVGFSGADGAAIPTAKHSGTLTVGGQVEVLMDKASADEQAPDSQLQPRSIIELTGGRVSLEADLRITAPSGNVEIKAVNDPVSQGGQQREPDSTVSLHIADGAVIDVSGTKDTVLSVASNIIKVEARGGELADSPRQRNGVLRSKTLRVDVRKGSPLLDIRGALGKIQRTTRERLSTGGRVTLLSDGDLVAGSGSTIDISGGQVTFTGDQVSTTRLVTDDGRIVDISKADPNRRYLGVLGDIVVRHDKWGVTERFSISDAFSRYETGYVEGRDAGMLSVNSPRLAFGSTVRAGSVAGLHQRQATQLLADGVHRFFDQRPFGGGADVLLRTNETGNLPSIIVTSDARLNPVPGVGVAIDPLTSVTLSAAMLNRSGLSRVRLEAPGEIRIDTGGALNLTPDAILKFDAGRIVFNDDVRLPGGQISAAASEKFVVPVEDVAVDVAAGVKLDVSGLWSNDNPLLVGEDALAPVVLKGGSIKLNSNGALRLAGGSQLNADAGAWREAGGVLHGGDGGDISLSAASDSGILPAELKLDGGLSARGFGNNGKFSLTANGFNFDGEQIAPGTTMPFDSFSSYNFNAVNDGVIVTPGTRITFRQRNLQLTSQAFSLRSGEVLPAEVLLLPDWQRHSVDLTLKSSGFVAGHFLDTRVDIGTGAVIAADPGAVITLRSVTSVKVDGRIITNGGDITLAIDADKNAGYRADQTIWLGDNAVLDVSGRYIAQPNDMGLHTGQVLDAGAVRFSAKRGSIITRLGSLIDVHGVATTLDLPVAARSPFESQRFEPVRVGGRAGTLDLLVAESALLQGRYDAQVAAPDVEGGRFSLQFDPSQRLQPPLDEELNNSVDQRFPHTQRILHLVEYQGTLPGTDDPVEDLDNGHAYAPVERLLDSGFTSLALSSRPDLKNGTLQTAESLASIRFDRDLNLSAGRALILGAPLYENTGVDVRLAAPYVAIGSRFDTLVDGTIPQTEINSRTNQPIVLNPAPGDGLLSITAKQVDVIGHSVWQGFGDGGRTGLDITSRGDIRFRGQLMRGNTGQRLTGLTGALRTAGDIRLSAQQIYPSTLSRFDMQVEGTDAGRIHVDLAPGLAGQALSAGGRLSFSAPVIEQEGVLRAPFGEVQLEASVRVDLLSGSLTSVSGAGLTVPFGQLQFQTDLTFLLGDITELPDKPPTRLIRLAAPAIGLSQGAQLDVSGGGDALAWEFVPGPGGSQDILLADRNLDPNPKEVDPNPSFAILPSLASEFAPWDPLESPQAEAVQGLQVGDTLLIEGGAGLAAGEYAILPARYALYGGYLVTPVAGSQDLTSGSLTRRADGAQIFAGRRGVAGTDLIESRSQGYAIEDGSQVRLRAEYVEKSLDTLFPNAVTGMTDAGRLSIEAGQVLKLGAELLPNRAGGRGAQVDISAESLRVVQQRRNVGIELTTDELSSLDAESLLLGGLREDVGDTFRVTTTAQQLVVEDGVELVLPELILVAHDLQIGEGGQAVLRSADPVLVASADLDIRGDAAVLAVSSRNGLQVRRSETPDTPSAVLTVAEGTSLFAEKGGLILDSTADLNLLGTFTALNGSLQFGSSSASLGKTDGLGLTGLVLNNTTLAGLQGTDLILRSNRQIDIYGALEDNTGNPIHFGKLNLDAPGLVGYALGGRTMVLNGGQVELANFSNRRATAGVVTSGSIRLQADALTLNGPKDGAGFTLAGFDEQRIVVRDGLRFQDGGQLNVNGNLTVETPIISAASGAQGGLDVTGRLLLEGASSAISGAVGLAARLDMNAEAITVNTTIALPSGILSLTADGADGITLLAGADLDVSGRGERFDTMVLGTLGGEIHLLASLGDVNLEGGRLDVSAAPAGGSGGRLKIEAQNGDLRVGNVVIEGRGSAGENGAGYSVDVRGIRTLVGTGGNVLTPLLTKLTNGDFSAEQDVRVRQGSLRLQQGERMVAQRVALSVDQGDLTVAGEIDTGGVDSGRIELAAGDTLAVTGVLDASVDVVDGEAGRIELVALDADADGVSGLDVGAQARLELNAGGLLQLYVPAGEGGALIGLQPFQGTVNGAAVREVLGVRVLQNPGLDTTTGNSTLTPAALSTEFSAMDAFLQAAQGNQPAGFGLRTVLDVRADGDLTVNEAIDLNDASFGSGNVPGTLMLRAMGDMIFNADLSDAVKDTTTLFGTLEKSISSGESWSYLLSSGADFNAASLRAVSGAGNVVLNDGSRVRTGTGNITVVSGGDVRLGKGAAIYTFGRDAGAGAFADVVFRQVNNLNGATLLSVMTGGIQFGKNGGDVRINARGDLKGKGVTALNQAWQPKVGGDYSNPVTGIGEIGKLPVIRGISVDNFTDGVGVLGGGRMLVSAGRDVSGLSLVMPGTITPVENLGVVSTNTSTRIEQRADTRSVLSGGSLLQVRAGRDFSNFYLQADQGKVRVSAGRDISSGATKQVSLLGVGDADVELVAGNRLQIDNVFDPGLVIQSEEQFSLLHGPFPNAKNLDTLFLSQSDNARLSLTSLAGDAVFNADSPLVKDKLIKGSTKVASFFSKNATALLGKNIVPAHLELRSIEGNARIGSASISSLPAADGYIRLLAGQDIVLGNNLKLAQADADPLLLPDPRFPVMATSNRLERALGTLGPLVHALTPVHANSTQSNQLVARNGDIRRSEEGQTFPELVFSNQTRLVAGRDILGLNVNIQHANAQHVSLVSAGRDIRQATLRTTTGALNTKDMRSFTIAGPGQLQLRAGRSIDLGTSVGIESIGNTANTVLPDNGASISVLAGYVGEPDYTTFMTRFIDDDDVYLPRLRDFLKSINVEAGSDAEARAALRVIDPLQRNRFLNKVLFSELKTSGVEATDGAKPSGDYSRGFDAIGILFPDPNPEGRLDIKLSKIFTLDGGDIDLLVPGGFINGGATSNAVLTKKPNELGVVTGQAGDINAFVDGDFLVNQSRVFALNGDLLMWSSNGDIDAGRGSKTALASPAPKTRIDPKTGQTIVEFPPNISGSGLLGVNGFLFAPRGKIDAGDAGIKATGNLTLGALAVVGAANINVGGISVGVPVANSGGIAAGLTGVSNIASSASKLADDSVTSLASVEDGTSQSETLGLLRVEILGFGE